MTKRVDSAFKRFFREKRFPKFKSKKNPVQAFPVPQHYSVNFETSTVKLPKIREIKANCHREFTGDLRTATVSKHAQESTSLVFSWKIMKSFRLNKLSQNQLQ